MENNMKKIFFSLLAALSLFLPPLAYGAQSILGSGSMLCETYAQSDDVIKLATESWALGFLSSANMRSKNMDLLMTIDSVAVIDAVEKFCASHPSDNIANAAIYVLVELIASADEDCTEVRKEPARISGLNHCNKPGSLENSDEPVGWSMTIPAVE